MGLGDALVPLVYVDDAVDAMLQAAAAGVASGSIYHIVDPSEITQREFLEFSKARIPHLAVTFAPMWLLYLAATGLQVLGKVLHRSVPLTWYRLRSLHAHLRFDSAAAQMALGWTPRMGARMGLRHTYLGATAAEFAEASTATVAQ
jgi:nucleoside-diphosphate-sugar epimerase